MPGTPVELENMDAFFKTEIKNEIDQSLAYQAAALASIIEYEDAYVAKTCIEEAQQHLIKAEEMINIAIDNKDEIVK